MTDTDAKTESGEQNTQQFQIQKIYIKDLSFESPNAPEMFTESLQPKIDFDLQTEAKKLTDDFFDVTLQVTATAKHNEKTAFLVEVKQSGIFNITGFPDDQLSHMLGSFCPNILFPYARESVSDLVTRGGFPPLLLAPVNFDALYAQHVQQQNQQAS
jgi:preprotein translocase subunit SecB